MVRKEEGCCYLTFLPNPPGGQKKKKIGSNVKMNGNAYEASSLGEVCNEASSDF